MRKIDGMIPTSYTEAKRALYDQKNITFAGPHSSTIVKALASNTRLVQNDVDGPIELQLHGTPVVTWHPNGKVTLLTGGWRTTTTKARMNAALRNSPVQIIQKSRRWFVRWAQHSTYEFFEGFVLDFSL